jgi:hypothetical protein
MSKRSVSTYKFSSESNYSYGYTSRGGKSRLDANGVEMVRGVDLACLFACASPLPDSCAFRKPEAKTDVWFDDEGGCANTGDAAKSANSLGRRWADAGQMFVRSEIWCTVRPGNLPFR